MNRRTMKVENSTNWQTRDLKAIIVRVCRMKDLRSESLPVQVKIGTTSKPASQGSGSAVRLVLYVPKAGIDPVQFAVACFLSIKFGGAHAKDYDLRYQVLLRQSLAWAGAMPVRMKPKPPKLSSDERRSLRRRRTLASIKHWTTKQKLAGTMLRKLRGRLRRYDREAAKTAA